MSVAPACMAAAPGGHGWTMSDVAPGEPDPSEVVPTSNSSGAPVDADRVEEPDVAGGEGEVPPEAP